MAKAISTYTVKRIICFYSDCDCGHGFISGYAPVGAWGGLWGLMGYRNNPELFRRVGAFNVAVLVFD